MKTLQAINRPYTMQRLLWVAAMATLLLLGAHNRMAAQGDDHSIAPHFVINSEDPETDRLPLKHTEADVNIAGVIADVSIQQVYVNDGENPLEAQYVFPASTQAAVYDMVMLVGDRVLYAEIQEKEQARKTYEDAKSAGKTASLLEQHRPNVFQMNVANIMPGDSIVVTLKYTELLVPEEGEYSFVYPTVVGPRYQNQGPLLTASTNKSAGLGGGTTTWADNPYLKEGEAPTYSFDFKASLNTGIPIKKMVCTSHDVDITYKGKKKAMVKLKGNEADGGNRDLILKYRLAGGKIESGVMLFEGEEENFFLAMLEPPQRVTPDQIPAREYIFVVDVSGSMNGFPLEVSKKLLRDLIGNLRSTDKFNVLLFAGSSSLWMPQSQPATQANITKAINHINNQRGGGGTQVLEALQKGLSIPKEEGYARSFVIATDGYVTVEKEAYDLIRKKLGDANFFAFGIGSSVNRYIIEGMAKVGMGKEFIVTNGGEAPEMADRFREYVQSPVLTGIKVDYKGLTAYDAEPYAVPDVLADRPVIIYGKYSGRARGAIEISGHTGGGQVYTASLDMNSGLVSSDNSALKYLWARKRIELLDDYNAIGHGAEFEGEVLELGLKYNLLTAYTSFVAVDSLIRNEGGEQVTVKQPLPLPQGVSDMAVSPDQQVSYRGGYSSSGGAMAAPGAVGNTYTISGKKQLKDSAVGSDAEKQSTAPESIAIVEEETAEEPGLFKSVEVQATFQGGGTEQVMKYLQNNLHYPKAAAEASIEGKVFVKFIIDEQGRVMDVTIIKGVHPLLDKEALRVIKAMKGWKPAEKNGKKVQVEYVLPVTFKLK